MIHATAHQNKEGTTMAKYYVMPKNAAGERLTLSEDRDGRPVDMTGVDVVELPKGNYFRVAGRGDKPISVLRVAKAVLAGQISISDLTVVE
jgi:hypothetical protein